MMRKKFNLLFAALLFALLLTVNVNPVYASELPTETTEEENTVYRVTITFHSNGGSGTMSSLVVESGKQTVLPANTFKKSGFQFAGWATDSKGTGTTYADKADVTELATADNDGENITLYAQWKLEQPKIKKVSSPTPSNIKVTFAKGKSVSGYEVQYSTSKKFSAKTTKKVIAAKTETSANLLEVVPNKKYYVRMRSYKTSSGVKQYSDWSKALSVKVKKGKTITNTKFDTAIEGDVKLSGTGTGYHAKFVIGNASSAVSFGLQYDAGAAAPYTGKTMALIENISSNAAGGQSYVRPGNVELSLNKTYHLLMLTDAKGHGDVYVNYKKIGSFYQPNFATDGIHFIRIEASGRLNGDKVDAKFSNIKCKLGSDLRVQGDDLQVYSKIRENKGLKYQYIKKDNCYRLYGTIKGLHGDWDSDYLGASYIVQFAN